MKPCWLVIIIGFSCLFGGFVGYQIADRPTKLKLPPILTRRDSVVTYDTVFIEKPVPEYITQTDEKVDTILLSVIENDTVMIPVSLPIVEKTYSDSTYTAVVSGAEIEGYPKLESIQVYNRCITIEEVETIIERKRWGWHIGVQAGAGYGFYPGKVSPYVGIGISYGFSF